MTDDDIIQQRISGRSVHAIARATWDAEGGPTLAISLALARQVFAVAAEEKRRHSRHSAP